MEQYYKYNRTYHLPNSLGSTSDDKFMLDTSEFVGKTIIISEKMDGENTNMYPDRYHARSIDSKDHESRHYVKGVWGRIKSQIPDGWRICGENLYAKHSLYYEDLESYFMVFSIWDENNMCLSWNDTVDFCKMLDLVTVPTLVERMLFDDKFILDFPSKIDTSKQEGFVIRNVDTFHYDEFYKNVGKWVRPKHVTSGNHWMFEKIVPNKLRSNGEDK